MYSEIGLAADGWGIIDGTSVSGTIKHDKVRASLLWRAETFNDHREARVFDEHQDDLDVDTAVSIFCKDLADRGIAFAPQNDPFNDTAWSTVLGQTYLLSAFT